MKDETCWPLKQRGRSTGHSSKSVSSPPCMFYGCHTTSQKGSSPQMKICANSLWLYSYFTQTSPSKNKNINYIFIYLQVFPCLSSGAICDRIFIYFFFHNLYLAIGFLTWISLPVSKLSTLALLDFSLVSVFLFFFFYNILLVRPYLWTPSHGQARIEQPARTYLQQLCTDTGCSIEDLTGVMDDRDKW